MLTKDFFEQNRHYGRRAVTDAMLSGVCAKSAFSGEMDRRARFVEREQLLDRTDWLLFVEQFRTHSDDADVGWRGEYFGKMMRGSVMTYQYTGNEALYALLTEVAEQMLQSQDDLGRFSTYTVEKELDGWDIWSRKYVTLGFLHYLEICRDGALRARIEQALVRHMDYIAEKLHGRDLVKTSRHWGGINSASILEPVMLMYNLTGKQNYLEFARFIIDFLTNSKSNIFACALEDQLYPYQYPVVKAYEMMSCFEGLLEYYRATGEERAREAVIRFADAVEKTDISIIGCAGCKHELFNHTTAMQTDPDYKGIMQETCVSVTWMKLCNQLLLLTGDAKYADRIERTFYNALYGAINEQRRDTPKGNYVFDSYSPLTLSARGRLVGGYRDIAPGRYYGCCVAIGAAGTALPLITALTATKKGVALNYYEKGSVSLDGMALEIDTAYPTDGRIAITLTESTDVRELALRIPGFAGEGSRLMLNGKELPLEREQGRADYARIERAWQKGDRVELLLEFAPLVHLPEGVEGKPESLAYLAVTYGPLVLARDARIGEVGTPVPRTRDVTLEKSEDVGVDCVLGARVRLAGQEIAMIDYASAGKTMDEQSLTEAWLPTHIQAGGERSMILPIVKQRTKTGDVYPVPQSITCSFVGELGELGARALADFEPRVALAKGAAFITFSDDESLEQKPEIYRVRVERDGIHVGYRDARGAVNGAATVALLLRKSELEEGEIVDWPDDAFRSVMVDPGTSVPTMEQMESDLRFMALGKFNRLHFHLIDHDGPGYISEALPEYKFTATGEDSGTPFTLAQLREIAAICKKYAIEIIPEIEVPGHGHAICRTYPHFKCEVENAQTWAVCPACEELYVFLDKLIGELVDVFPDCTCIHLGSDELEFLDTPAGVDPLLCHWTECTRCKALREREGLADMREEYYYFIERCRTICAKYDKRAMIWSDQMDVSKPVPAWFSRDILMEFWRVAHKGRGPHEGCSLAKLMEQGFEVVNAYYPYAYTFMEHYLSPEKMKTWTAHNTPEQPEELSAQMLGGDLCVWAHARESMWFNRYVTPAAIAVFGDKLWAGGVREHDGAYKAALAEFLFGDASFSRIFDCVGDIIPPRTTDFYTYLAPDQIDKALVAECVAALREQKQSYLTSAYIGLLEKIAEGTDTARTQTKKDLEA